MKPAMATPQAIHPVVIIGNGGHSRSCVDAWDPASPFQAVGCTGPNDSEHGELPYLGTDDVLPGLRDRGIHHAFVALGSNALREKVARNVAALGFELATLVAPTARVAPTAAVGEGSAVLHGAIVGAFSAIGGGAIINTGASVDHDCRIGNYAHIAPGTHLAGGVTIGDRAFLGVGVSVIPGIVVGSDAVVGAGAVVVSDIPDSATVYGVPARAPGKV
jgi:UDP-perosamine 4-acetyltransferase